MSSGFENDVMLATNVNFNPGDPPNAGQITADGQLLIGNAVDPKIRPGFITSSTLIVGYSDPDITLEVAGGASITKLGVDTASGGGSNPVLPSGTGLITLTGAQVAPGVVGSNVLRTNSLAANTATIEIQQASAVAAKDTTKNGVAHFNSAEFTNDEGFISLIGSSGASIKRVVRQVFTSNGTYTPTSGMVYCDIEVVGGGGGGGGVGATGVGQVAVSGPGGGGGYGKKVVTAATIGASQAVTIGAGGTAGTSAPTAGGGGGTTSVGAIVNAGGGVGGTFGTAATSTVTYGGGGGSGTGGDVNCVGAAGVISIAIFTGGSAILVPGTPGVGYFGGQDNSGTPSKGAGGLASAIGPSSSAAAGNPGADGIVIITEYCN